MVTYRTGAAAMTPSNAGSYHSRLKLNWKRIHQSKRIANDQRFHATLGVYNRAQPASDPH